MIGAQQQRNGSNRSTTPTVQGEPTQSRLSAEAHHSIRDTVRSATESAAVPIA
jgi:hypothetical protein